MTTVDRFLLLEETVTSLLSGHVAANPLVGANQIPRSANQSQTIGGFAMYTPRVPVKIAAIAIAAFVAIAAPVVAGTTMSVADGGGSGQTPPPPPPTPDGHPWDG